jgi:hypothetical protein
MPPKRAWGRWFGTPGFRPELELPPWREHRLPKATAQALAALIDRAGLGRCAVLPGTTAHSWEVLVELGPVRGHGELVVLATLGDAAPLLGRAFRLSIQRHGRDTEPPSSHAEAQIREALADVWAAKGEAERAEEVERGR